MKDYKIKIERKNESFTSYVLKHDEVVFYSENNPTNIIAARKAGEYIANANNTIPEATQEPIQVVQQNSTIVSAKPINTNSVSFPRKCCGRG